MDASVEAYHKATELNPDNAQAHFSKVVVVHAAIPARFNQERHLCSRLNFKVNHDATVIECSQLFSGYIMLHQHSVRVLIRLTASSASIFY